MFMSTHPNGRPAELRSLISDFLSARLNAKLEKLAEDDPKRSELLTQFIPALPQTYPPGRQRQQPVL
jgi:CRISPR-associated protein Csy1